MIIREECLPDMVTNNAPKILSMRLAEFMEKSKFAEMFDSPGKSLLCSEAMEMFIEEHSKADTNALRLRFAGKDMGFDLDYALLQIESRRKYRRKLGRFTEHKAFYFPSGLAAQQSSDQKVAAWHSGLMPANSRWLDLTAGLGIDALSACLSGHEVTAVEIESWKCDVLRHNASVMMGKQNAMEVVCADCAGYLEECGPDSFDCIFLDPARRGEEDERLYGLRDCMPDVTRYIAQLLRVAPKVMVKASPMLDPYEAERQLKEASSVITVSLRNESKETLITCRRYGSEGKTLHGFKTLSEDGQGIEWVWERGDMASPEMATLRSKHDYKWLYESDTALTRWGKEGEAEVAKRFPELRLAAPNSKLFLSEKRVDNFPGREIEISAWLEAKGLKKLKGNKFTIVSRDYPLTAGELRKKYGILESETRYLYAFTVESEKVIAIGERQ